MKGLLIAQDYLENAFNKRSREVICSAVHQAYLFKREAIERLPLGAKGRQWLDTMMINRIVEGCLAATVKANALPFEAVEAPNSSKSHYHLQLRGADGLTVVAAQTRSTAVMPRRSRARIKGARGNQIFLPGMERLIVGNPYVIITHGYRSLSPSHILLGIPSVGYTAWDAELDLTDMTATPLQEQIPEKQVAALKESVFERLREVNERESME